MASVSRERCPKCSKMLIDPAGPASAKILLVGEFPGKEEIIQGIPFVGETGKILKAEMIRAGLPIHLCIMTNLWRHGKDEKECDVGLHLTALSKEMKGKKLVLLMGSDLTEALWDCGVMELSGLEMEHEMFPGTRLFVSPNPALVMHGPVGELRLAMERFADAVNV